MRKIVHKINKRWTKLRLKPIRVLCCHDVSPSFNPETTWECDWMETRIFKKKILELKKEVEFVSIEEAYNHIVADRIRIKRYCCLTFDDGLKSLKEIVPWLLKEDIPVTIFVNPAYLKREGEREKPMQFLSSSEFESLLEHNRGLLSVGSHGYDHRDCSLLTEEELSKNIALAEEYLDGYPQKISFFAYPCDKHNELTDSVLKKYNLIPVYCDGGDNYDDYRAIHRVLFV